MVGGRNTKVGTDVFIVGGGPGGLAAGIAARQRGLDVMVADRARPSIDKACGEGVMPNGVAALHDLGVIIPQEEAVPFRGIRFLASNLSAEARFQSHAGRGVRRTTLHRLLEERARAVGVTLLWGTGVRGLAPQGVSLDEGVVPCRWVIGADGEGSRLRGWGGLDTRHAVLKRFGFRRHFRVAPWTDVVEVYWCDGAQVFVTPVGQTEVCVALLSRDPHTRLDRLLVTCPQLARHLAGARPTTPERGALSVSRGLPAVVRGRLALIGDASGSIDGITGEGLSLLFQQAQALAEALAADDVERYEVAHRRIRRMPALMGQLLLAMDRAPWLLHRALRAFAAEPALFSRLLALHVGTPASPGPAVRTLWNLGWRLLAP